MSRYCTVCRMALNDAYRPVRCPMCDRALAMIQESHVLGGDAGTPLPLSSLLTAEREKRIRDYRARATARRSLFE